MALTGYGLRVSDVPPRDPAEVHRVADSYDRLLLDVRAGGGRGGFFGTDGSPDAGGRPAESTGAALVAAAEMFRTRGPEVSILEIVEVGVGTLYRHFSQRESLVMAVDHESLRAVCDEAIQLLANRGT